jgi:putative Mn2+ efflux pump MntP
MGFGELALLALGVSMDAFAVSICKGLGVKKAGLKEMSTCGIWFGGFQALMPLVGYFLGALFYDAISTFDHWIAFALLALIGANMLREALSKEEGCECCENSNDMSMKTMFVMAVATSIDALAVGISLAMAQGVNIWLAIALIGIVTFAMCCLGVKIGSIFGSKFEKKAQIAGGAILILLGIKILLEHLGVLPW